MTIEIEQRVKDSRLTEAIASARTSLDEGRTLPYEWYTDPYLFGVEQERIFARSWQYVGHRSQLPQPGSYFTAELGPFPVVVSLTRDGELVANANVCPHRGNIVASGCGRARTLTCGYHSWTFDLDGRLRAAPRADGESDFDISGIRLQPLAIDTWGPLIFINRDVTAPPLSHSMGEVKDLAVERGFDLDRHPLRASRSWDIAANWKVTLDNNTECYHCQTVHPEFSSKYHVDQENYIITTFDHSFSHISPLHEDAGSGEWTDFHTSYAFPNFMVSGRGNELFYTYSYVPIDPGTTRQYTDYFFPEHYTEEQVEHEIAEINKIMQEDWAVFEGVQRGMTSGAFPHGRLMPDNEALLIHNQRQILDALASTPALRT